MRVLKQFCAFVLIGAALASGGGIAKADSTAPAGAVDPMPAASKCGAETAIRNVPHLADGDPKHTFDLCLLDQATLAADAALAAVRRREQASFDRASERWDRNAKTLTSRWAAEEQTIR